MRSDGHQNLWGASVHEDLFFCIYYCLCLSRNYKLISFNNPYNPSNTRSRSTTQSPMERPRVGQPGTNRKPRKSRNFSDPKRDKKTSKKPRLSPKRPTWPKILYLKPPLFSILYQKEILEYINSKQRYGSLKSFKNIKVQSNIHSSSFIFWWVKMTEMYL